MSLKLCLGRSPSFWPGSVSDPMTYSKGGSWERPSSACPYPNLPHLLPTWEMDRLIVPLQNPGEVLITPSAKPSRNQGLLFLPHSKFSSTEVFGLSTWLRPPCSFLTKDTPTLPRCPVSGLCPHNQPSAWLTGSCQATLLYVVSCQWTSQYPLEISGETS